MIITLKDFRCIHSEVIQYFQEIREICSVRKIDIKNCEFINFDNKEQLFLSNFDMKINYYFNEIYLNFIHKKDFESSNSFSKMCVKISKDLLILKSIYTKIHNFKGEING